MKNTTYNNTCIFLLFCAIVYVMMDINNTMQQIQQQKQLMIPYINFTNFTNFINITKDIEQKYFLECNYKLEVVFRNGMYKSRVFDYMCKNITI
jgi:hypothetical protein